MDNNFGTGFVTGFCVGLAMGIVILVLSHNGSVSKFSVVENGHAIYAPLTGKFTWLDHNEEEK